MVRVQVLRLTRLTKRMIPDLLNEKAFANAIERRRTLELGRVKLYLLVDWVLPSAYLS